MTRNQAPFQPQQPIRQLRRSQTDRKLSGVCGGVAEYLNVDSTVVRIVAVVGTILSGGWLALAYLVAIVVMPDGKQPPVWNYPGQAPTYPADHSQPPSSQPYSRPAGEPGANQAAAGSPAAAEPSDTPPAH